MKNIVDTLIKNLMQARKESVNLKREIINIETQFFLKNERIEELWNDISHSAVSNSLQPHGLYPTRLFVNGIFQARILEWVAILFSTGSS